jgi:IS605 OrfB family transposase
LGVNKKPIKTTFDNKFKNHVMETDKPDIFIKLNITYENINMLVQEPNKKIITQMNIVARICYSNIKYDITSSNIVVNSIKKAYESINSYYSLKMKGMKANKPKYLESDFYSLIFCGNGKEIKNDSIKLSYGKVIYKNQIKYFNKLLDKKPELFIKKPSLMNNSNYKLGQIEIKKLYNRTYAVLYTFDKTIKPVKEESSVKLSETISIDLGLQNLMMIHDPSGKQIIVKGGYLISINEYYNKKIAGVQSLRDIEKDKYKKEKLNNEILQLLNQRERKLNGMMNKIITSLYTLYSKKKLIIIGYNEGWKQNINLRKDTNRKFYDIPYKKLISKMKYKFKEVTEINEINEAYTSKCDSLGNERIEKQEVYMGKRVKRGLFSSSVGKLINADLNGAINIMRKYSNGEYKNIKGINLCNPERLKITS